MHHRQGRQMVIRSIEMAIWQRQGGWPVILHSDRRTQFRSGYYQRFLHRNTLLCSMSAVGHCGDNAAGEGFFGMLKRE
jgi:putative transposase